MSRVDKLTGSDKVREIYSDFFVNLTPHPDTKQLVRLTNEDAVKRSIRNLVNTGQYERLFQPDIKCNIQKILFENITEQSKETLKLYITETIENYEPRCKLLEVRVDANDFKQEYVVTIIFLVINKPDAQSVNIKLKRLR